MNKFWDKYRRCSRQTICVLGILVLSAKLSIADGHFSEEEEDEILKNLPHDIKQKKALKKILEEGINDKLSIEEDARIIKNILGTLNTDLLEFIVAVLIRICRADGVFSQSEKENILIICKEFEIEPSWSFEYLKNKFNKKVEA